jgi:hypothetical protein
MRGAAEFVKGMFDFPIVVAEVGVERGVNAKEMIFNMNIGKLFLVDHYLPYTDYHGGYCPVDVQDAVYRTMFANLYPYLDKVVFITKSSVFASTLFVDGFFDFVYIDGNHNYESVMEDIKVWFPKVRKGGLLGGHDFDPRNVAQQDVAEAVNDFAKENKLDYIIFPCDVPQYSDWGIIK